MKWSEAVATGIPQIDHHHDMLFRLAERFRTAVATGNARKSFETVLRSLEQYADAHFNLEERCMDDCGCPTAAENRDAHSKFRAMLTDFRSRYQKKGFNNEDASELVAFLETWLTEHIGNVDLALRGCADRWQA